MLERDIIETKKGAALGIKITMPNAKLILIIADSGYVSCGYINPETAEKMKDCAVIVSGVDSFSDLLKKKVSYISKKAKKLG
ncbi:MAG: DUF1805 domain-containing protein, partial [Candidatus Micrarchaeota archaeon]